MFVATCVSPVIIALDYREEKPVLALAERLSPQQCRLKVGKELFTACGPALVKRLVADGFDIFLDLKFHDIPNTVAHAVAAARDLGVWMVNVHAAGGARMLEAARAVLSDNDGPLLIAVTVLTSMTEEELRATGVTAPLAAHIETLAGLTQAAGLDGVVCSAREAGALRARFGENFLRITPGIRPQGSAADDQRRIVTPEEAMQAGSSYLVIGRPVTQAVDPLAALNEINHRLGC